MKKNGLKLLGITLLAAALAAGCGSSDSSSTSQAAQGTTAARTFAVKEDAAADVKRELPAAEEQKEEAAAAEEQKEEAAAAEENKEEAAAAEEQKEEAAAAEEKKEESGPASPLHLESSYRSHSWYDPAIKGDGYQEYASVEDYALYLDPEDAKSFPELEKTLEQFHKDRYDRLKKDLKEYTAGTEDLFKSYPDMVLYENGSNDVRRADTEVLSFVSRVDMYYGGAHPDYFYGGYNFDTKTGKEIKLEDVIKDTSALPELLGPALSAEEGMKYDLDKENIDRILKEKKADTYSFTIEQEGVRFWFSPYDISSFASGMFTAELLFSEHPEIFTGKYQNAAAAWGREYLPYDEIRFRRNGKMSSLMIYYEEGEYGAYENIKLTMDGKETVIKQYGYSFRPYLLSRDGKYWLFLISSEDNDYTTLYVLDLNGAAPKVVQKLGAMDTDHRTVGEYQWTEYDYEKAHEEDRSEEYVRQILLTDPDNIWLSDRMDLLSTYSGSAVFTLKDDGSLVNQHDWYEIKTGPEMKLKLNQNMKFPTADPETLAPKGTAALPEGTEITFYRTNGISTVWFLVKDGRCIRVDLDSTEWPQTVNGIEAPEIFDGMMFAG
ncbi:MAG: hypothetical protein IJT43_05190 [Stomatobaculum sp.]|nr:hypothetical protein [Stomatobaculum sp.]